MTKARRRAGQLVGCLRVSSLDQKELRQVDGGKLDKKFVVLTDDQIRFTSDFASELLRINRTALHLYIDEADTFPRR